MSFMEASECGKGTYGRGPAHRSFFFAAKAGISARFKRIGKIFRVRRSRNDRPAGADSGLLRHRAGAGKLDRRLPFAVRLKSSPFWIKLRRHSYWVTKTRSSCKITVM